MNKIWAYLLLLTSFLGLVSSQVIVQGTSNNIFNVGDLISSNVSVSEQSPVSGYLNSYLLCNGNNFLVGKSYLSLQPGQLYSAIITFPASVSGGCSVMASFNGESDTGSNFTISSNINLNYHVNDLSFSPGDTMILNGTAIKDNGNLLNGALVILSPGIINKTILIANGTFTSSFIIGNNLPGNYNVSLYSQEKDTNNNIINFGQQIFTIQIKPTPTSIKVLPNYSELNPPSDFSFNVSLLDQAGNPMNNKTILMKLFDPNLNLIQTLEINSPGSSTFLFLGNSSPGFWNFNFYYGNLLSSSEVLVGKNQNISTSLSSSSIIINNIGNVPYNGSVQYSLQNSSGTYNLSLNISLDPGKSYVYPLTSYLGSYNISSSGQYLGSITGAVIGLSPQVSLIGLIAIGVIILVSIFFAFRKKKTPEKLTKSPLRKRNEPHNYYEVKERTAYMAILSFDKPFDEIHSLAKKYGLPLSNYDSKSSQVLFYSPSTNAANKIIDFSKEAKESAHIKNISSHIALNLSRLDGSSESLRKFSDETKKLLRFSDGKIIVTEQMAKLAGLKIGFPRNAEIDGINVKIYSL